MTTATNWLLNWAIAYSTPYLVNYGPGNANLQAKIFFIWFGCCFLCIAFVYLMIYETKGLTLEQIDELYSEVKVAHKSVGWQPTTTFREIRASIAAQGGQTKEQVFRVRDGNVEKVEEKDVDTGNGSESAHNNTERV